MKRGKYWYYRLANEKTYHSTGQISRSHAEAWIINKHNLMPRVEPAQESGLGSVSLGEYIEPFFVWNRCPHGTGLLEEGKDFSESYAHNQRRRKETYIYGDEILDLKLGSIRRSDILDFRKRLIESGAGYRTINMTIGILKIILHEALFREDIDRNPTMGIGDLKYDPRLTGIFTRKEMIDLFAEKPGMWKDYIWIEIRDAIWLY